MRVQVYLTIGETIDLFEREENENLKQLLANQVCAELSNKSQGEQARNDRL